MNGEYQHIHSSILFAEHQTQDKLPVWRTGGFWTDENQGKYSVMMTSLAIQPLVHDMVT
jgi:hypothetical protein